MSKRFYLFLVTFVILLAASIVLFLPMSEAQGGRATPRPTRTPRQTAQTMYVIGNVINARDCPRTTCAIVTTFSRGDRIRVTATVTGSSVLGNTTWYQSIYDGDGVYIHSSLLSRTRPSSSQPTRAPSGGNAQPTNVPSAPVVSPVPPPTENVSVAPPVASFSCSCDKTCEQMASCEEAYFQLNQCGCSRRDSDGDGVPCESICSGG